MEIAVLTYIIQDIVDYVLVGTFHKSQDFCTDSDHFEWLIWTIFVCGFEAAGRTDYSKPLNHR